MCQSVTGPAGRALAQEPLVLLPRLLHRHRDRRAARASAPSPPSPCCCRSPSGSIRSARSSCWPASTTARSTAARPRRSWSTSPARRPPSSPRSTATRWRKQGRAGVALGIAAIGSFFAGCVATVIIAALAAPLTAHGAAVRPGRLFRADGARARCSPSCWRAARCSRPIAMILVGIAALHRRHGPGERRGAPHLRLERDRRRHRRRGHRHGHVRHCRDPAQSRDHAGPRRRSRRRSADLLPNSAGHEAVRRADRARHAASGRSLGSCPATAPCSGPSPPTRWRRSCAKDPSRFGRGAIEGVAGPGVGQQRRRADRVHSAAHARHPAQRGDGADGRRHDHPRHRAGPAGHDQAAAACSGA